MSEKAAAAQKWAEAKEALETASLALDVARATHQSAEDQEREAWAALEAMAGRINTVVAAPVDRQYEELKRRLRPLAGNLPVSPLG